MCVMSSGRGRRTADELKDLAADLQTLTPIYDTPEQRDRAYDWVMLATTLLGGPGPFMRWMLDRVPFPGVLRWRVNEVEVIGMGARESERKWKRWNQSAAEHIADMIEAGTTPEVAIRESTGGSPDDAA
jgi:hypothetical protein